MGDPLFEMDNLCMNYGSVIISNGISFSIESGEAVGLIGPNGAGKTTLFDCITGICRPMGGRIRFRGQDITGMPAYKITRLGIVRTFQITSIMLDMTVEENVMSGAYLRASGRKEATRRAEAVMEETGITGVRGAMGRDLGLMYRKRLELAKALATEPKLLIADESMAGLSQVETEDCIRLYESLKKRGMTMLITEHITEAVMRISDRIVAIAWGRKIAEGKPEDVINDAAVIDTYLGDTKNA